MMLIMSAFDATTTVMVAVPTITVVQVTITTDPTDIGPSTNRAKKDPGTFVPGFFFGERRTLQCPLLAQSGHALARCKCPLMTQADIVSPVLRHPEFTS
jgi:hypothetical protein